MSLTEITLETLSLEDDDFSPVQRKKSRNPKNRLPASLLWQIPASVLKQKKGRKLWSTDRYNDLGCKGCNISFHKKDQLRFHMEEEHQNKSIAIRPSSKTSPRSLRQNPATNRRSPRMLNRSRGSKCDDDDIEVLDDLDCSFNSQQSGSSRPRRSSIEVVDLEDSDEEDDIQEITLVEEQREDSLSEKVSLIQKQDEEILLVEDDNIGEVSKFKRKSEFFQQSEDSLKKPKMSGQTDVSLGDEMIEVKNKSGKSMFVKKSTLSKVMSETRLKSGVVSPVARHLSTSSI